MYGDRPDPASGAGDEDDVAIGEVERVDGVLPGDGGEANGGSVGSADALGKNRNGRGRDRGVLTHSTRAEARSGDDSCDSIADVQVVHTVADSVDGSGEVAAQHHRKCMRHGIPDLPRGYGEIEPIY